jgi:hypothetical protein
MAHAVTFDTLKFVKTLKGAGVSEAQAEAFSTAVQESHEAAEVATKSDVRDAVSTLRQEMSEMKFELLKWMVGLLIGQTGLLLALLKFFPAAS